MKSLSTGKIKEIKVGFSWTIFLFSWIFGIPFFLRRVYTWGAIVAGVCFLRAFMIDTVIPTPLWIICEFGFWIYLGFKGNEITVKHYLNQGWSFANNEKDVLSYAKTKMKILSSSKNFPRASEIEEKNIKNILNFIKVKMKLSSTDKIKVKMKFPPTGKIREIKIGFNWSPLLFIFLPIFTIMFIVFANTDNFEFLQILFPVVMLVFLFFISLFVAITGNERAAKHYILKGWVFADKDEVVEYVKSQWDIGTNAIEQRNKNKKAKEKSAHAVGSGCLIFILLIILFILVIKFSPFFALMVINFLSMIEASLQTL